MSNYSPINPIVLPGGQGRTPVTVTPVTGGGVTISGGGTPQPTTQAPSQPINVPGQSSTAGSSTIGNSAAQGIAQFLSANDKTKSAVGFDPNLAASDLIVNGQHIVADAAGAIMSVTLERTITGASTLTLVLNDPHRVWLNSPLALIMAPATPVPLINGQPSQSGGGGAPVVNASPGGSTSPVTGAVTTNPDGSTAAPGSLASILNGTTPPPGSSAAPAPAAAPPAPAAPGSDLASNAAAASAKYQPTTVAITDGTVSITFALVQISKTGDQLTLTFEDKLVNELRYAFPLNQGTSGLALNPTSTAPGATSGPTGNVPAGGQQVGATMYGGPSDPTSGTVGASGHSLVDTFAFAELSVNPSALDFSALGHLPMGTLLYITYNGRTVIGEKLDVGAGGGPIDGHPRSIDLWYQTAAALGFTGSGVVTIAPAPPGSTPGPTTTPLSAALGFTSVSPALTGPGAVANTGGASGQTRADFMAMVVNQAWAQLVADGGDIVQPNLAYPPSTDPSVSPVQETLVWGGNSSTASSSVAEDAWSCLVRVANQAQWRVFSDGTTLWFGPDEWLLTGPTAATFNERETAAEAPAAAVIADNIDFDWDIGKAQATLTVNTTAGLLTFPQGRVVEIANMGVCSQNGQNLWIVSDVTRHELTQPDVTVSCVQAQPELSESALAPGSTNTGASGGANASGQSTVKPPPGGVFGWPFPTKSTSQYQRVDQGWDLQEAAGGPVLAVAPGHLYVSTPDPGGFGNDYPCVLLDQVPPGAPSDTIYYGHVHVIPSLVNTHVTQGQVIAYTNTFDGQNGSGAPPGWLEIGFARSGTDAPIQSGAGATQAGQTMKTMLGG